MVPRKGAKLKSLVEKTAENILLPIATRLGSAASGLLVGLGVSETHATNAGGLVQTGIIVVAFVAIDLVASYMRRKQVANKAVANAN